MSGYIDKDHQQWERCNCCGASVKIQTLTYGRPNETARCYWLDKFPERTWLKTSATQKLDLCSKCA